MKKRIVATNIILGLIIVFSIVALIFVGILTHELRVSPQFLVHIIDYPSQYYKVQDPLIELWKNYCYVALSFISFILVLGILIISLYNYFVKNSSYILEKRQMRAETKKQARISKLQAELDELQDKTNLNA